MKTLLIGFAIAVVFNSNFFGQTICSDSLSAKQTIGTELDLLPYISGGYYASVWYGIDQVRLRAIVTNTTVPEFVLTDGYKNNKLKVYAFIADYFFKKNFEGFWLGTGVEYWDSKIEHDNEPNAATYSNTVFTLGGGYVWKIYKNFFLNPWAAFHLVIGGDKKVNLGGHVFEPSVFTPEVSLKIGWHF